VTAPATAVIWDRLGEYHHARLDRAARIIPITAIEIFKRDNIYAWDEAKARGGYSVTTLANEPGLTKTDLRARLTRALDASQARVVAVPGWSETYALLAIDWARRNKAGVVLMSDSNQFDARRRVGKERIKSAVVAHASAGLVAGQDARSYLSQLGLNAAKIEMGYDVVDNKYFQRPDGVTRPGAIGAKGFIAVSRFIARKNLDGLIEAYRRYLCMRGAVDGAWPMILVGDGEERAALETQVEKSGLTNMVSFKGFRSYNELPSLYHGAGALVLSSHVEQWGLVVNEAMAAGLPVLVSKTAGASRDLVMPGDNGGLFAPGSPDELASLMIEISETPGLADRMGAASARIIMDWGLERFATGLANAARTSVGTVSSPGYVNRAIFRALLARAT
jgi:glycosyltransferase involved in cell wall biosynthesis